MHNAYIVHNSKKKIKKKKSRKRELINVDAEPKRSHGVSDFQSSAPTFKKKKYIYIYIYILKSLFSQKILKHIK